MSYNYDWVVDYKLKIKNIINECIFKNISGITCLIESSFRRHCLKMWLNVPVINLRTQIKVSLSDFPARGVPVIEATISSYCNDVIMPTWFITLDLRISYLTLPLLQYSSITLGQCLLRKHHTNVDLIFSSEMSEELPNSSLNLVFIQLRVLLFFPMLVKPDELWNYVILHSVAGNNVRSTFHLSPLVWNWVQILFRYNITLSLVPFMA